MLLDPKNVNDIFDFCCTKEEVNNIDVDGIAHRFRFDKTKLEEKKSEILDMLHQLPQEFMHDQGGGYSFLAACNTRDGRQWTGMHLVMEQLFMMGIGCGVVDYLLPREIWPALPGGVPYLVIKE